MAFLSFSHIEEKISNFFDGSTSNQELYATGDASNKIILGGGEGSDVTIGFKNFVFWNKYMNEKAI